MLDEEIKKYPWTALRDYADKLTPEPLDYCVHELPWLALIYCVDKLTNEQKKYCEVKKQND